MVQLANASFQYPVWAVGLAAGALDAKQHGRGCEGKMPGQFPTLTLAIARAILFISD